MVPFCAYTFQGVIYFLCHYSIRNVRSISSQKRYYKETKRTILELIKLKVYFYFPSVSIIIIIFIQKVYLNILILLILKYQIVIYGNTDMPYTVIIDQYNQLILRFYNKNVNFKEIKCIKFSQRSGLERKRLFQPCCE